MIESYRVAVIQAEKIPPRVGGDKKFKENVQKNIDRYCALIDYTFSGPFAMLRQGPGRVRLVTFGEYSLTGLHHAAEPGQKVLSRQEIIEKVAIRMPGPETDFFAAKARQYDTYVALSNLEYDSDWPDYFFNSGIIISPRGKIILKYRKTVTNVPIAMHTSVHDIMDKYQNPISKKYDPFPVVDTEIGRLAVMICGDIVAPEIPRVYSIQGAEVVLHLTSGQSTSGGGNRPLFVTEASIRTRAYDNCVYFVHANWGPELGAYYPRARISGGSNVFDYLGNELARADDTNEQIVIAAIDIEAARKYREQYFKNYCTVIRTELYAPFYNKPIYPANTFLKYGPVDELMSEKQRGYFKQAMDNLKQQANYYSENDI